MSQSKPDTTDDAWKETVREICDRLHFGKRSVFNDDCAREIVALIEERHHDYFCGGKTLKERAAQTEPATVLSDDDRNKLAGRVPDSFSLWRRFPLYMSDWRERRVFMAGDVRRYPFRFPWSHLLSVRMAREIRWMQ